MINRLDLVRLLINSNYRVYDGSSYKLLMYYYRKIFFQGHRSFKTYYHIFSAYNKVDLIVHFPMRKVSINGRLRYKFSIKIYFSDEDMTDLAKIIAADEQIKNRKIIDSK